MAVRIDLVKDVQDLISKATGGIIPASGAPAPQVTSGEPAPVPVQPSIPVVVTKTTDKPVGWKEKIKGSWKAITAFVGALLTLVTQIQAITPFLPDKYRDWIGLAVAFLTAVSTFLVRNETWVEGL